MKAEKDGQSQRERFEQAARELGVELDEEKLKEALRKIAPERESQSRKDGSSDAS